jgi:threonine synthase
MGTAHPAKFTDAIEKAIPDYNSSIPAKVEMAFMQDERFSILADNYDEIKKFILTNAL